MAFSQRVSGLWPIVWVYKSFLKLCWCDSGWRRYQLNNIDGANIKQSLAIESTLLTWCALFDLLIIFEYFTRRSISCFCIPLFLVYKTCISFHLQNVICHGGWFGLWPQYPGSVVPLAMFYNQFFNLMVSSLFSRQHSQWQQFTRWNSSTSRRFTSRPCSSWTFTQVIGWEWGWATL